MKTKVHFTKQYLLDPTHPISIVLVGCGGTGTQVLSCLARINQYLIHNNHKGLLVSAYDNDTVDSISPVRQLFSESDIGMNKAVAAIDRINSFYGYQWEGINTEINKDCLNANIIISCTDNITSRLLIKDSIKNQTYYIDDRSQLYWLDFGNNETKGQVILGTCSKYKDKSIKFKLYKNISVLPKCTDIFNYKSIKEHDTGPSCSVAESINRQDMFINSTLAQLGCDLLWKMFKYGLIDYHGLFLNLDTMNIKKIKL